MKLINLKVKNIATYKNYELKFDELKYPVFITGETGAGKTTFFVDAITVSLCKGAYGHTTNFTDIIMRGTSKAEIQLTFKIEDKMYRIKRIFEEKRGASSQSFLEEYNGKGWTLLTARVSEVDRKLRNIMGLDYDGLLNSVIIRQGDVYNFIKMQPSQRRNFLLNLFKIGLDELKIKTDEKRSIVIKEIEKIDREIQILKETIDKEAELLNKKENLENERKQLEREIERKEFHKKEIENSLNKIRKKISDIEKELRILEEKNKNLEEKYKELNNIKEQIGKEEAQVEVYPKWKLEKIDEVREKINEYYSQQSKIISKETEFKQYKDILNKIEEANKIENLLNQFVNINEKIKEVENKIEEIKNYKFEIQGKINIISDAIKTLDNIEAECPVCGSKLTIKAKENRKKHLEEENKKLNLEIGKIDIQLKNLINEKNDIEKKINEKNNLETRLEILKESISGKKVDKEEINKIEEQLNEMKILTNIIKKEIEDFTEVPIEDSQKILIGMSKAKEALTKIKIHKQNLINIQNEIEKIEEELKNQPDFYKEMKELKIEENNLSIEYEIIMEEIKLKNRKLGEINQNIKIIEEEIKKINEAKEKYNELSRKINELKIDNEALLLLSESVFAPRALPTKLLEDRIRVISRYASYYIKKFNPDIDINIELVKGSKPEEQKVEVTIISGGYARRYETYSGGESTLIGFAIRLAIGKAIAELYAETKKPKFLIIDEGFGPLDERKRSEVAEAISELYETNEYEQIIIISHQTELKANPTFRTILEVYRDNDGYSKIRDITETAYET